MAQTSIRSLPWGPVAAGYEIPIPPVPGPRWEAGEPVPTAAQVTDLVAIQQVQMTYGQLHEHGTADEIAELFHPDSQLFCLYLGSRGFTGRVQIRDWYAWWLHTYATGGEYYRHRPVNQVIDLQGDRAMSHSILLAEGAPREHTHFDCCMGRYTHELIRDGEGWLFFRSWIILHHNWHWPQRHSLNKPVINNPPQYNPPTASPL